MTVTRLLIVSRLETGIGGTFTVEVIGFELESAFKGWDGRKGPKPG